MVHLPRNNTSNIIHTAVADIIFVSSKNNTPSTNAICKNYIHVNTSRAMVIN